MNFLSVLYAKAGITVDGVTALNNTATALTPATNDNSTKIATTAFVKNQNYYPYPTGTTAQYVRGDGSLATFPTVASEAKTLITEVYNETGATLTKGTVVYINGGHGNLPTITKALANSDATSAQTYGVVQSDITDNNNGFVVVIGSLTDIPTNGYPNGTILYLSPTTAGGWTSTKPYAPQHIVYVGIVVREHPTQGVIEIRIQNGYEMDELHNVSAQNPANGDILQFNYSTQLWTKTAGTTTNITEGTNLYFTDARARAAISLTTTGTSGAATYSGGVLNIPQYQAALTNPVTGTGTTNYLPKFTGTSALGDSLVYDNGTSVGIGTASPSVAAGLGFVLNGQAGQTRLAFKNTYTGDTSGDGVQFALIGGTSAFLFQNRESDGYFSFEINGNENLRIAPNGNVGIGTASPTTKLGVAGDITLQLSGAAIRDINSNALLSVQSSNELWLGGGGVGFSTIFYAGANERMRITSAGDVGIGTSSPLNFSGYTTLTINGTSGSILYTQVNGVNAGFISAESAFSVIGESRNKNLWFATNGTIKGGFFANGNYAIGTTTDAGYKLDVNGTARVSGALTAAAGLFNIGSASDTWAASSSEGLAIKGSAFSGAIQTITSYLDNTSIRIGAGVSQKTGILINGQTTGAGSSVLVSTGGATRLTIASTGAATFSSSVTANNGIFNGVSSTNLKVQNGANANTLFLIQSFGTEALGENASILFKSAANSTDTTYAKGLISFVNNGTGYGRGSLIFATNNSTNSTNVTASDVKLTIAASGEATFSSSVTAGSLIKSGGTSSQYLMADGSTSTLTNPVTGTGTTNYITKWVSGSAVGNSVIYDNGTNVGIGTSSPNYRLESTSTALFGTTAYGVLNIAGDNPSYIKIKTNIPFSYGSQGYTVNIKGFQYGSAQTLDLQVCWHQYADAFYSPTITSKGSFAPVVRLARESGLVVIVLTWGQYWPKLYVESVHNYVNDGYANGWTWADENVTGDKTVTLSYKNDFGDGFVKTAAGLVGIGTNSPSYKLHVVASTGAGDYVAYIQNTGAGNGLKIYNADWDLTDYLLYASNGGGYVVSIDGNGKVNASSFTANNRTILTSGGLYDNVTNGNNIGIGFAVSTIISTDGAGTYSAQNLGNSTYPWYSATFVSSVTTGGSFISNVINNYGLILNRSAITTYNGISLQTAGSAKWFLGMRENLSSNNYIIYSEQLATDILTLNIATGAATFSSSVTATTYYATDTRGIYVNSGSASYLEANSTNNWAYLRLSNNGTVIWDVASYNGGALEFRPGGGASNAITMASTGNLTAVSFSGAGTGLTGTASALSIGGNAATATSAGNADTVDGYHAAQLYTTTANAAGSFLGGHYSSGGTEKPDSATFGAGKLKLAMLSGSNLGFGGGWNDVLWLSAYNGGDVKSSHALVFDKYSSNVWISDQNFDSNTWGTGYLLLSTANYNNYAPTLTGSGASGTWGINITGNANYATTAGALTSMNISQFTNDAGYITSTSSTFSYTASVTLSPTWQNTGVSSANLTGSGVYIVTCNANDFGVSGGQYNCTYTGIMYWFAGGTNGSNVNEIVLHHTGHADNGRYIYLRTINTVSADGKTYLQISGNGTNSGASNYQLTFKKIL